MISLIQCIAHNETKRAVTFRVLIVKEKMNKRTMTSRKNKAGAKAQGLRAHQSPHQYEN